MEAAANPYRETERYFDVLRATLSEVYARSDADSVVSELAANLMRSSSDDERLLFFHSEPIATAEDLTGERPTPAMYNLYAALVTRLRWDTDVSGPPPRVG